MAAIIWQQLPRGRYILQLLKIVTIAR